MLRPLSRLLIIQRNYFHKTAVESLNQLNFIRNGKYLHGCQRRLFSTEVANIGIPEVDKQQINYAELNFDDQTVELIKTYETEMLEFRKRGSNVCDPYLLRRDDWEEILETKSITARKRCYAYQLGKQLKKQKSKESKIAKQLLAEQRVNEANERNAQNTHIVYGMGHTALILRITQSSINKWLQWRLAVAKQYSPKIVFDCSYDAHMKRPEAKNTAEQLTNCFSINRKHTDPFDLSICGADFNGHTMRCLQKFIPTLLEPTFPMDVHAKSIVDVFPIEKLVYLTPHCDNDLEEFSADDIYVVGGIVDKHHCFPVSLEKATALGIRMARLPLDRYFHWKGDKTLTLDQMLKIMLELKTTRNWRNALQHIPRRKIAKQRDENEIVDETDERKEEAS